MVHPDDTPQLADRRRTEAPPGRGVASRAAGTSPFRPARAVFIRAVFTLAVFTLTMALVIFGPTSAGAQTVDTGPPVDENGDPIDCTWVEDPDAVVLATVLDTSSDAVTYDVTEVEDGGAQNPLVVTYTDGFPAIEDDQVVRVRVVYGVDGSVTSDVGCGGTTSSDDQPLDLDEDAFAKLSDSVGETADEVGGIIGRISLGVIAATIVLTALFRLMPRTMHG